MPILPPTSFILEGVPYTFIRSERVGPVEDVKSWEMGQYPKVHANVPLRDGGTVAVYAHATHWNRTQINVRWDDDEKDTLTAWLPKNDVRPATESEWDIDQYNRCPESLRAIRWRNRPPGFLRE